MPVWIMSILSSLAGIGLQMGMKLIGYEFVSKAAILSMQEWSKSTPSHWDDQVTEAAAKAWGVPVEDLKP